MVSEGSSEGAGEGGREVPDGTYAEYALLAVRVRDGYVRAANPALPPRLGASCTNTARPGRVCARAPPPPTSLRRGASLVV